ncbi:uncharacterized protein LOC111398263 [Olea europaea var. sylvestris]|uniref:uncharacterized protein LOC111398263 n=1 Tax=Olea europaea var. sylvestris TaxID=158386 RepID=UPI000C1D089A|nr:uncharacterized protein LOC111398263 [Olea europaea var. sylvestris]
MSLQLFKRKLPAKCKDPSMFTIPCTIGDTKFEKAMLDLGASINIMPYSMYTSLKLGPLVKTSVVIQLADRSNAYHRGVIEHVLVKVNELVFPADFYVLDMENSDQASPILLGGNHVEKESGELTWSPELKETVAALNSLPKLQQTCNNSLPNSNEKPLLSVLQAPTPDLKSLPNHL